MIKLKINGKEITAESGGTILQIARENGVEIPNMCHDDRVAPYGSCGVCTVEIAGNPRLIRACSTMAADGMDIITESDRISANRRLALELMISDHSGDCKAPCRLACPAGTNCQGYVRAIADGDFGAARATIMENIPFPASIGRVCPRPCEDACRRTLLEEPIAIAQLKQYAGDRSASGGSSPTSSAGCGATPISGKTVGIVGGGPAGLSAAYYLRQKGHAVTVYEAMPHMGGMLRYGIPEYRLPKSVLQREIDVIEQTGVEFRNNARVTLADVRGKHDVVIVAIGAWNSAGLRCPGEELEGVVGGINFLYDQPNMSGKAVAVVGGGNTAMDACRTAVRLGAEKVYCVYRRTRDEMPAQDIEISEAIEEGVEFKFLTNPIEIIGEGGKVKSVKLQVMELGEPDSSGRRAPVPVEGKTEIVAVDVVIAAIGQKTNPAGFEELALTKWGTIAADESTFATNIEGVLAIGDATNGGADIAVAAIGEGLRCAEVADKLLITGKIAPPKTPWIAKDTKTADDFADRPNQARAKVAHRPPAERSRDFAEVYSLFGEEEARREAARCLECGCSAYSDRNCKLYWYANMYGVNPDKFSGEKNRAAAVTESVPQKTFVRNPEKCILCGLCVRTCAEVEDATALGLSGRGFSARVLPALGKPLADTSCTACGKCAEVCPTGAFTAAAERAGG